MKLRREIRKLDLEVPRHFDDQLWPVTLALGAWGAVTGGLILARGRFLDPQLLANGSVWLLTLIATLLALFWAATTVSPERSRRLKLCVALSLVFHTLLVAVFYHQRLAFFMPPRDLEEVADAEPEVPEQEIPQVFLIPKEQADEPEEFERPLVASDVTPQTAELTRQRDVPREVEAMRQAIQLPDAQPQLVPRPEPLRQPQDAVARRAEQLALRSRRPATQAAPITSPVSETAEAAARPTPRRATELAATARPLERAETSPANAAAAAEQQPQRTEMQASAARPQEREFERPEAVATAPAGIERATAQAAELPTGQIDSRALAQAAQPLLPRTLESQAEMPRRRSPRRPAAPDVSDDVMESLPDTAVAAASPAIPQRRVRDELPTMARDERPARQRELVAVAPAADVEPSTQQLAEQTLTRSTRVLDTQPTSMARTTSTTFDASGAPDAAAPSIEATAARTPAASSPTERERTDRPEVGAFVSAERSGPRATQLADVVRASAQDPQPAAAASGSRRQPIPEPSPAAFARAERGFTGEGASPNAGSDQPASPQQLAPTPMAAARRNAASQRERGPALSPSTMARIAKSRASAEAPASTLRAQPIPNAEVAGVSDPTPMNAASSAALERQNAAVPLGGVTAAVGATEIDTGSRRIVPEQGSGPGAGGGQPTLVMAPQQERSNVARRGGAPLAAMPAEQIATLPAAPPSLAGGSTSSPPPSEETGNTALARAAPRAAVAEAIDAGAAESLATGRISPVTIEQRQAAEAHPGLNSGGATAQTRRSRGPAPAAAMQAPLASLAAIPQPGGALPGAPRAASAGVGTAESFGVPQGSGRPQEVPSGAVAGTVGGRQSAESAAASRAASGSTGSGSAAQPDAAAARLARSTASTGSVTAALSRASGEVPVIVAADAGEGGLGWEPALSAGLPDRRASPQADMAHAAPARLVKKRVGGNPAISGLARDPTAAFAQRGLRQEDLQSGGDGRPSAQTEAAIELGLEFLARRQLADGRWSFDKLGDSLPEGEAVSIRADAAATGLALLAFLGAGYDHFGDRYQPVVQQAIDWLVAIQSPEGELFPEDGQLTGQVTRFYSHGIAAIALCEAYGMTGDPELEEPAQRALDYIARTQHRALGGWRYQAGLNSDLSVTGWQVMALRSGELAGLRVSGETYERVREMVARCRDEESDGALFRYNPWASPADPRTRHGREASTVMTSVGLLMQLYLGGNRDDRLMQLGADHLLANLPEIGSQQIPARTGTLGNPRRDTYYWYYGTQVMYHMGGPHWEAWNDRLHPLLVESQTAVGPLAGSWNPQHPVPDKWASYGGRLYVTALNLLSLEVYYRHLPLYEMTAE